MKKVIKAYCKKDNLSKVEKLLKSSNDIVEFELEKKNILNSKYLYIPLVVVIFLTTFLTLNIFAEQIGSSPESGTDSKFTQLYDELVTLGIGTEGSGAWGDWGSRWNRVMSASTRIFTPYAEQSLQQTNGDLTDWGEGGTWTQTNTTSGFEVWKDEITGLYWGRSTGSMTNVFTRTSCDFFSTVPRGNYDGSDTDCGNAINYCATLSAPILTGGDEKGNWYLPNFKELKQAYVHAIYKKTNTGWTTSNVFWSNTESQSNSANALDVNLSDGSSPNWSSNSAKTTSFFVRCVYREY